MLLSMILQNFSKIIIWVDFQLNQQYIAKNICVQKEVNDNCCKGSCQLIKKLNEDEKNQGQQNEPSKPLKEIQLFINQEHEIQFSCPLTLERSYPKINICTYSKIILDIFHPPPQNKAC